MYHITTEIESAILAATPKQAYQNNRDAIATLQEIKLGDKLSSLQLDTLAKFNGWGSISQAFDLNADGWAASAQTELKQLLGSVEYNYAAESIVNAHYTSFEIVKAIWSLVKKLGFTGGRILEPSCGVGNFLGLMPTDIVNNSEIVGVELDPTVAAIASHLYPEATIYSQGFETVDLPDNYFDLVIGNVPFGSYGLADVKYDHLKLSIHNYFLAKSVDLVRPGGFIVFITSPYTLDALSTQAFREYLGGKQVVNKTTNEVEVIGGKVRLESAIRLPAGVFKQVAGTMVSPDILVFQRLDSDIDPNPEQWVTSTNVSIYPDNWDYATAVKRDYGCANLNQWFVNEFELRSSDKRNIKFATQYPGKDSDYYKARIYPETHNLLGVPSVNKLYGEGFALESDNRDLTDSIASIAANLHCCIKPSALIPQLILVPPQLQQVKNLAFCQYNGKIYQRHDGELIEILDTFANSRLTVNRVCDRISDFWKLRKILDKVIDAQSSPKNLANYQQALKLVYDSFVSKHGKINDKANLAVLGQDPSYYLVRTLEKDDSTLADIFSKRVCRQYAAPQLASNPTDALVHSLNTHGRLDLQFMSEVLGNAPHQKIVHFLESKGAIFFDPATNVWVLAEQYLSGNVYQKLQDAIASNLERNIDALKSVQPAPMLPSADDSIKCACLDALLVDWQSMDESEQAKILSKTISVKLGTNWISAKIYQKFAYEVLKIQANIKYLPPPAATWAVNGYSQDTTEYGTKYLDSCDILTSGLNLRDPRVVIRDNDGEVILAASNEATEDARNKLREMRQAFLNWLWLDKERAVELCLYYNQNINVMSERKFSGNWLQLPGSSPDISLRPWQLNAVSRILENTATFLAHDVGTGKSYSMIAAIMECRRLGLAKKPMLVVLNGTEKQLEADWRRLYPMSNLLVPTFKTAEDRKLFTAAIKTCDFDGVILTHSQFFSLAMSAEYQLSFLEQEKDIIQCFLTENKHNRQSAKSLMTALKNVERRINKVTLSTRKDNHIDFEGLTDMLVVDECHQMKNLAIITKMNNVRGIPTSYSQRATDSYMKILHTLGDMLTDTASKVKGKVVLATGTILSNTMAEVFNWQRMMQLPVLKNMQIDHFDAWVSQFGEAITGAEISPAGQYKVNTRFKSFCNLQVLKSTMGQFVDIVTVDMLGNSLARPNAEFIDVIVPASDSQMKFLRDAVVRSEAIKNRIVTPDEDNMLKVTTDLTKSALSMRLMGDKSEAIESKLHDCALNTWKIYQATDRVKGTQLIFCDFSTPKNDRYNVYYYLRDLLIALGIPSDEIAFIHDHDKAKRAALFDKVNRGDIRVLMGSTGKLGTGCNVHKNGLWAMHHVDAPWRPADIEQREGRGIRQGNGEYRGKTLPNVLVFRYITERLDALRWQTLQWKQEMIKKFMNGHDLDSVEDCDQAVYSFAQVKSLATGNPMLIEDANLRNELASLLMLQRSHNQRQSSMKFDTSKWSKRIATLLTMIDDVESDYESLTNRNADNFEVTFSSDGTTIKDAVKAGEKFLAEISKITKDKSSETSICSYADFNLIGYALQFGQNMTTPIIVKRAGRYDLPLKFGKFSFNINLNKPQSVFSSINTVLDNLKEYLTHLRSQLETARIEQLRCESLMGQSFPQAARLVEIEQRLAEISAIMSEDEAALGVKSASDNDTDAETSESESEDNQFWLQDDNSNTYNGVDVETVQLLQSREINQDWMQSLIKNVAAF